MLRPTWAWRAPESPTGFLWKPSQSDRQNYLHQVGLASIILKNQFQRCHYLTAVSEASGNARDGLATAAVECGCIHVVRPAIHVEIRVIEQVVELHAELQLHPFLGQ